MINIDVVCPIYKNINQIKNLYYSLLQQNGVKICNVVFPLTKCNNKIDYEIIDFMKDNNIKFFIETETSFSHSLTREKAIKEYLETLPHFEYDDYLFPRRGKKNTKKSMSRQSFWNIFNEVKRVFDIDYTLSCHSTRKTFAYQALMKNKEKAAFTLALLQSMFKHSKQTITMKYIGLQADDEKRIYESLCL